MANYLNLRITNYKNNPDNSKNYPRGAELLDHSRFYGMAEWPVSRVLSGIVIYLEHALLHVSSDLYPEVSGQPRPSLFDLAPDGVCQARQSPVARWALTPPFHPDPVREPGGLLSVALSCGSCQLDVIQRLALWSPDFPLPFARQRLSGPLRF